MPEFTDADEDSVHIGRANTHAQELATYVDFIKGKAAGRITISGDEKKSRAKRLLAEASKANGMSIRSTWESDTVLAWSLVKNPGSGAKPETADKGKAKAA